MGSLSLFSVMILFLEMTHFPLDVLFVTVLSIDRTSKPEFTELSTPVIPDYIA